MLAQGLSRRQCDLVDKLLREQFIKTETGQGHHELKGSTPPATRSIRSALPRPEKTLRPGIAFFACALAWHALTGMPLLHWYAMKCESAARSSIANQDVGSNRFHEEEREGEAP